MISPPLVACPLDNFNIPPTPSTSELSPPLSATLPPPVFPLEPAVIETSPEEEVALSPVRISTIPLSEEEGEDAILISPLLTLPLPLATLISPPTPLIPIACPPKRLIAEPELLPLFPGVMVTEPALDNLLSPVDNNKSPLSADKVTPV